MKPQTKTTKDKYALAVLISDIHFNLKTVDIASVALQQAYDYANDADLPLIIAGDLHDTKANVRGECINAINKILEPGMVDTYIIVGNHDLINEKSNENSLGFIKNATIVNYSHRMFNPIQLIAYQSNVETFKMLVNSTPKNRIIICHQGLIGTEAGEYFHDKSAIDMAELPDRRIISGHYHTRQTIELPNGGFWDYIGNPYTLTFGEAKDPEKGFQVLYSDGSLEFIPTNLRKHIVIDIPYDKIDIQLEDYAMLTPANLVWVKIRGPKEELVKLNKQEVGSELGLHIPFKLELISDKVETKQFTTQTKDQSKLFDEVIQNQSGITNDKKKTLKKLWKHYAS